MLRIALDAATAKGRTAFEISVADLRVRYAAQGHHHACTGNGGATLTRAFVELLHRGLASGADENSIDELQTNLGRADRQS